MSEAGIQIGVARARAARSAAPSRPRAPAVDEAAVRAALAEVMDPELPMLSVVDLGIVHRVDVGPASGNGPIRVEILPTFVGCPALELIKAVDRRRAWLPSGARSRSRPPSRSRGPPSGSARPVVPHSSRPASRRPARVRLRQPRRAHRPRAARPVPALRFAPDGRREPLRADPVPDHPLLRRLPPAVRIDQVGLMGERAPASSADGLPAIVGIVGAGTMGAGIAPGRARGRPRGRPLRRR